MNLVIDASVAVKWVVPEALSDEADRLLERDAVLMAPDLLLVEAANVLWKKHVRHELSSSEASRALAILRVSTLVVVPAEPLLARALALAGRLRHPVYDCIYLALAERERATLVTADDQLLGRVGRRVPRLHMQALRTC